MPIPGRRVLARIVLSRCALPVVAVPMRRSWIPTAWPCGIFDPIAKSWDRHWFAAPAYRRNEASALILWQCKLTYLNGTLPHSMLLFTTRRRQCRRLTEFAVFGANRAVMHSFPIVELRSMSCVPPIVYTIAYYAQESAAFYNRVMARPKYQLSAEDLARRCGFVRSRGPDSV